MLLLVQYLLRSITMGEGVNAGWSKFKADTRLWPMVAAVMNTLFNKEDV